MFETLNRSWALLLGMMLLMVGNGLQGTLLGVRGALEGFSTFEMSIIMSAYFVGFLGGSHLAPEMIRRVGHIRVFAALGSFVSAILILFPAITDPIAWTILRVAIGFCFSGVYVTAESWLNNSASNENRGKALSLYMIVQMIGIVTAQGILLMGNPSGFVLFIIPSVLVSISFAPILLSATPMPPYETAKPMGLIEIFKRSPLSCVGMFLLGGVYSALFGMSAVFGTSAGMSVGQISMFVSSIYVGGLLLQYPIGFISDRMDRRLLIMIIAFLGTLAALLGIVANQFFVVLTAGLLIGGAVNPLYALLIAYMNDYLEVEDMASASGRLVFINGIGAIAGPLITGWLIGAVGPAGYFVFLSVLLAILGIYALYRTTQRAAPSVEDTGHYAPVSPSSGVIAVEVAQDYYIEEAEEDE